MDLLTRAEAAALLKCSRDTVTSMVNSGLLEAFQVGLGQKRRQLRITRASIESLIHRPPSAPAKRTVARELSKGLLDGYRKRTT
jgi:excisionase family DNA binding protein